MKIAAIDLGSNSIHMVIVEVGASGAFRVIDRETEMIRLGSGTLSTGVLSEDAIQRALAILKAYRRLTEIHGVEKILAVATSATREAENGEDFLDRIGRKVGIWPRAITGEEEARLVYLAALHSIHLGRMRTLVVDIGGGSVELALGRGGGVKVAVSEKLGVLRMTERYLKSDPVSPEEERRLVKHVQKTLAPSAEKIRRIGFDALVGTSGTILALGRLAAESAGGERPESLHHVSVSAEALKNVRKRLSRLDGRGRLKLPGLDRRRADIIVGGAIVLDALLDLVGARKLVLCEWALREGILLDYINRHPATLAKAEAYPDVRRRSVLQLAERCQCDTPHSRHVAGLALALFDGSRKHHGLGDEERSLLEYAALLHNAGHHISHAGHHKHTYYLIKNGGLRGFDPLEIELIAIVSRSHRRGMPKRGHPALAALPRSRRETVQVLAALLGVADGLDRSHQQRIRSVTVAQRAGILILRCRAAGVPELEVWGVRRRLDPLAKALEVPVQLEIVRPERRPAARGPAARKPGGRKPAAHRPAARKPSALKPAARKPAARKPAARRPAARRLAARRSAVRKPASHRPAARRSAVIRAGAASHAPSRQPAAPASAARRGRARSRR